MLKNENTTAKSNHYKRVNDISIYDKSINDVQAFFDKSIIGKKINEKIAKRKS